MEGTGAPDVLAIAVDLGVIDGRDVIAVPDPAGGLRDESGQIAGDSGGVPGPILGEGLQRLPVGGAVEGEHRLGDGVLLDVEGQRGDPLDEAAISESGEGPDEGPQQCLPDRPEERSFGHGSISEGSRMGG